MSSYETTVEYAEKYIVYIILYHNFLKITCVKAFFVEFYGFYV